MVGARPLFFHLPLCYLECGHFFSLVFFSPTLYFIHMCIMFRPLTLYLTVIAALGLTNFAKGKHLPTTHIPHNRAFRTDELAPFASNVQFQRKLSSCTVHAPCTFNSPCHPSLVPILHRIDDDPKLSPHLRRRTLNPHHHQRRRDTPRPPHLPRLSTRPRWRLSSICLR
jgi:hypothetical protein